MLLYNWTETQAVFKLLKVLFFLTGCSRGSCSTLINVSCLFVHTSVCPKHVPYTLTSLWGSAECRVALSSIFLKRDPLLHQIYNLPLDIIPTSLLKGILDIVCLSVISTVNSSAATWAVSPSCMQWAASGNNYTMTNHFKPISICFWSQLLCVKANNIKWKSVCFSEVGTL